MEKLAHPLHKVLYARAMEALLQDGLHFILGLTIDDEGKGDGMRALRGVEEAGVSEGRSSLTWKTL